MAVRAASANASSRWVGAVDQVGDRHVDRDDAAAVLEAECADDAVGVGDGAGRQRDDDEPVRHQARGLQGGFGHSDDRAGGDLAGGRHAGVTEAGDDESVGVVLVLADLLEHTDGGDRLLGVAFDAGHADRGVDAGDRSRRRPRPPVPPR